MSSHAFSRSYGTWAARRRCRKSQEAPGVIRRAEAVAILKVDNKVANATPIRMIQTIRIRTTSAIQIKAAGVIRIRADNAIRGDEADKARSSLRRQGFARTTATTFAFR